MGHYSHRNIDPEVLQSGFGVKFLIWSGEFQENCRRILMAIFSREFLALFFQGFRPKKCTPKLHDQKSSAFLSNFTFSNPSLFHGNFLLTGETKLLWKYICSNVWWGYSSVLQWNSICGRVPLNPACSQMSYCLEVLD